MRNLFYSLLAKITGKNNEQTPIGVILNQMTESRPLPLGMKEFDEWADRIISGACIPGATPQSQKFALADMVNRCTENDFEEDAFFIKKLRKSAINQVCIAKMEEIRNEVKARLAEEEAKKASAIEVQKVEVV